MDAAFAARFWAKVDRSGDCWIWLGARSGNGYGKVRVGSVKDGSRRLEGAHRIAYELACGPIPPGAYILHSCNHHPCVRPDHLRVGTASENIQEAYDRGFMVGWNGRKTHCKRGHPFSGENLILVRKGRACRECRRLRDRKEWKRRHQVLGV